jgi:hypothetical protein
MGRSVLTILALSALMALLQGCGGGYEPTAGSEAGSRHNRKPAPAAIRVPPLRDRVISGEHLRRAVLRGLGRDYLGGTQAGPPSFALCLQRGLRRLLGDRTLRSLALVYRRPSGQQLTAQALAELAVPIGDRCGGRRFVPEMIEASMAFRAGHLPATGASGSGLSAHAFASERYSFRGRLPRGWRRSDTRLVPLLMPREVLSVGTFPMPVGGGGNCGREPVAAIRRMRPGDALVSIQEYAVTARMRPHLTRSFPPKSHQPELRGMRFGRLASVSGDSGDPGVPVTWGVIPFSEAGRAFDALVYFRGRPSAELRDAAARVLAELVFEKRTGTRQS